MYTPLEQIQKNNQSKKNLLRFLRGLSRRKIQGLDSKAKTLTAEAYVKIDCLKCANCCKTMQPTWKKTEVKRVAAHLGLSYAEYFDKYLYIDKGDITNKKAPCQHLAKDNTCSIYDIRPEDCKGFPHTQKRDFKLYVSETHMQNMDHCPITVHVVEQIFNAIMEEKKPKTQPLKG